MLHHLPSLHPWAPQLALLPSSAPLLSLNSSAKRKSMVRASSLNLHTQMYTKHTSFFSHLLPCSFFLHESSSIPPIFHHSSLLYVTSTLT